LKAVAISRRLFLFLKLNDEKNFRTLKIFFVKYFYFVILFIAAKHRFLLIENEF